MTTASSPLDKLRQQAGNMARALKRAEQGSSQGGTLGMTPKRYKEARAKDKITFAIAMDDKIVRIEMSWDAIREATEDDLTDTILKYMNVSTGTIH